MLKSPSITAVLNCDRQLYQVSIVIILDNYKVNFFFTLKQED